MPLGNKALKKRQQAADAKAGVVRNETEKRKIANAKPEVHCTICQTAFRLTAKNADARIHAENRHPQSTFAECFPECVRAEAAGAAEEKSSSRPAPAAKKNSTAGGGKKKKDNSDALLMEGLAAALPKKKGGK